MNRFQRWLLNRRVNKILRDINKYIPPGRTTHQLYPLLVMIDSKLAANLTLSVYEIDEPDEAQDLQDASLGEPDTYVHMLN